MSTYRSVLVVRLSALGDVLFALPAVQALIHSGVAERVDWLVEARAAALLEGQQGLGEVIPFPRREARRWLAHAARLRRLAPDVVLDFQGNLKSRLQLALIRSPRKLGFAPPLSKEGAHKALDETLVPGPSARHRIASNLALVERLGVEAPAARPDLPVDPGAGARMAQALDGIPGQGPLVALHPGTSAFGQLKRWPAERFSALARLLAPRARVCLTGGPGEGPLIDRVLAGAPPGTSVVRPGSLADLTAFLDRVDLLVAADSLPLHLANALGTPVVGLYGPKDPAVTGPFFDRSRVVTSGTACSPCSLRRCYDTMCMERLEEQDVLVAVDDLFARAPS